MNVKYEHLAVGLVIAWLAWISYIIIHKIIDNAYDMPYLPIHCTEYDEYDLVFTFSSLMTNNEIPDLYCEFPDGTTRSAYVKFRD